MASVSDQSSTPANGHCHPSRSSSSDTGWQTHIYEVGDPDDRLLLPREFHDWVAYRLHFYESTSGWCRMIRSKSDSEQAAIGLFFRLLDEFYSRTPNEVARLAGIAKSYGRQSIRRDRDQLVDDPIETVQYPEVVKLVTYTDDPGFFRFRGRRWRRPWATLLSDDGVV